jgi:hypothetical protein
MSTQFDNTNSGAIFKNDKKTESRTTRLQYGKMSERTIGNQTRKSRYAIKTSKERLHKNAKVVRR